MRSFFWGRRPVWVRVLLGLWLAWCFTVGLIEGYGLLLGIGIGLLWAAPILYVGDLFSRKVLHRAQREEAA